jgi:Family of unknown function (DUF6476)
MNGSSFRALKILVAVLGVMLVGGVVVLGVAIVQKIAHRHTRPVEVTETTMPAKVAHHAITLPAGVRVLGIAGDGNRVILRLGIAGGGEALWLIDWGSGARLAAIDLTPTAGAGSHQ